MPEELHDRLEWLEGTMERIAIFMYRAGLKKDCFGMPFYETQDKLAALIGLPDDYWEFIELEMDPRILG